MERGEQSAREAQSTRQSDKRMNSAKTPEDPCLLTWYDLRPAPHTTQAGTRVGGPRQSITIHRANSRLRASKGRAANGNVVPLQSFSAPCRNSNFLSEQFTTIGATGEIGDTGARDRCCRSQKISIISLRHRRGSCIVISTEDIGTIRVVTFQITCNR